MVLVPWANRSPGPAYSPDSLPSVPRWDSAAKASRWISRWVAIQAEAVPRSPLGSVPDTADTRETRAASTSENSRDTGSVCNFPAATRDTTWGYKWDMHTCSPKS